VADNTGDIIFVLFNKEVERLLDTSANKFLNRLCSQSLILLVQIQNLSGKTFVFNHYNFPYLNIYNSELKRGTYYAPQVSIYNLLHSSNLKIRMTYTRLDKILY